MRAAQSQPPTTSSPPSTSGEWPFKTLDEVLRWASAEGPADRYAGLYALMMGLNHDKHFHYGRAILDFELQDREYRTEVLSRTQELLSLLGRAEQSGFAQRGQLLDTLWPPPHDITYSPEPLLGILSVLNIHSELLERRLIVWDAMMAHKTFTPERQEKVRTALLAIGPGHLDRNSDVAEAGLPYMPLVPQTMETFEQCNGGTPLTPEQRHAVRLNYRLERLSRTRLERVDPELAAQKDLQWFNRCYQENISLEPRHKYRARRWRAMAKYGVDLPILPYQPPHPDPKSLLEGSGLKGATPLPPPRDRKGLFAEFAAKYPPGSEHLLPKPSERPLTFLVPVPPVVPFVEPPVPEKRRYKPIIDEDHPDIQRALDELAKLEDFYGCFRNFRSIASIRPEPMTPRPTTQATALPKATKDQGPHPINRSEPLSSADETRSYIKQCQEERGALEKLFKERLEILKARALVDQNSALSDIERLDNHYRGQELQLELRSLKRRWIRLLKAERYHQHCLDKLEGNAPTPTPNLHGAQPPAAPDAKATPSTTPAKNTVPTTNTTATESPAKPTPSPAAAPAAAPTPPPAGGPNRPSSSETIPVGEGELILERSPSGQLSVVWAYQERAEYSGPGSKVKVLVSDPSTTLESLKAGLLAELKANPPQSLFPDGLLSSLGQHILSLGKISELTCITLSKGIYNLELAEGARIIGLSAPAPGIALRIRGSTATFDGVKFYGTALDIELERATWTLALADRQCVMKGSLGQSSFCATSQLHCDATRADLRYLTIEGDDLSQRLSKMLFRTELFSPALREKLTLKHLSTTEWEQAQRTLNEALGREALRDLVLSLESDNRLRAPTTQFTYTPESSYAPRSACDKVEIRTHDDYNRLSFLIAGPQDKSPCRLTLDTYKPSATKENYYERVASVALWKTEPVHYHQALFDLLDLFFDDTLHWPFVVGKRRKQRPYLDLPSGVSQCQ